MLYLKADLPKNIKPCKILPWDKIKDINSEPITPEEYSADTIHELALKMIQTCIEEGGIGLAAPQIGIFKRAMVCQVIEQVNDSKTPQNCSFILKPEYRVYINPDFTPLIEYGTDAINEYCLSVPNRGFRIVRHVGIKVGWDEICPSTVTFFDRRSEFLYGMASRVFLHELDHLNGISIPQRWEMQKKIANNL